MDLAIRIRRTRLLTTALAALTLAALAAGPASADIIPTPYGGTSDATTGGHGDLTVGATFTYSDASEDLKKVVVDTPAGGVGNPNAIPYADRCPQATFDTGICPVSSQIGVVTLKVTATAGVIPVPMTLTGTISEIQTTPEVPTQVGAYIDPGAIGSPIRSTAVFYPVTSGPDGDFRLRSVTSDFPRTASTILGELPIQVDQYEQKLFGKLANGTVFITNPTRCDTWKSYGYLQAYDANSNADADPLMTGTNDFIRTDEVPTTPVCTTLAPFDTRAKASISSGKRFSSPTFDTTVEIPNLGADPQGAAIPKSIVATLPKALNVDVQQIGRVCSNTQFAARSCPASTKMGTVDIKTPMIVDGLQGEAYLTQASPGGTLPDLGLIVHGAINFTMRGVNHYVNTSQLQSTFDNIPQVGFSKFALSIAGGPTGLLKTLACPTGARTPTDMGPVSFEITSYQGQVIRSSSPVDFDGCYNATVSRLNKCVKSSRLKLKVAYASRSQIRFVRLSIRGMKTKTIKRSPFRVNVKLGRKIKTGKTYRYTLRVYYKPAAGSSKGKVVKKTGKFKRCA
ncbi:MAG: hypothetical protein ACRDKI_08385 [Solirubrobacterales bacterium]